MEGRRKAFGARVSELRTGKQMTKSDLARKLDVTVTCVWNWERGNTFPRPDALERLAKALGVLPRDLENIRSAVDSGNGRQGSVPAAGRESSKATVADAVQRAREEIAALAGLDIGRVKIVLEYMD